VAVDRDTTLRKAEKLLRQGRLDAAIAEYLRVIEDQPRDWNTANILGDLYVRAGQVDKAVAVYTRIADHLAHEGFLPKASAVYKKILKIKSDEEPAALQLAELAARQGLLADAKSALTGVADRRKARGDLRGAAEVQMRLGSLDPADLTARLAGARAAAEIQETPAAVSELKALAEEFNQRGRPDEALKLLIEAADLSPGHPEIASSLMRAYLAIGDLARARGYAKTPAQLKQIAFDLRSRGQEGEALQALADAAAIDPADVDTSVQLARAYLSRGDLTRARQYLTREVESEAPDLLWTLAEVELRGDNVDAGIAHLQTILIVDPGRRDQLVLLGCSVAGVSVDAAYRVIDLAASAAIANDEWAAAAAALNEFVNRQPGHIPALMRLVEICVDGRLEATMYSAQAQLADAYLAAGRGSEARVVAEDLVAREPWDRANIERFRRALTQLGEPDVDTIIADRLSGQTPFVSTDLSPVFEDDLSRGPDVLPTVSKSLQHAASLDRAGPPVAAAPVQQADAAKPPRLQARGAEEGVRLGASNIDILESAGETDIPSSDTTDAVEIDLSNLIEEMKPSMGDAKPEAGQDVDGVFKGFRDEVSREHLADAAAQHYKLAVAYLDMGMVDDAVKALEVAVRAPRLRFAAALMLAHISLKRGTPSQAIEWFERAAEAPAPSAEAGRALLYELADTLESHGETARALAIFLELQADAGEYRDLSTRLERLARVQMRG